MDLQPIGDELRCYADTLRYEEPGRIVLLSMFGPRNAVRASWAKLVQHTRRTYMPGIHVGGVYVSKEANTSYFSAHAQIGRGLLHTLLFHPHLSVNAPDTGCFYTLDAAGYFARLAPRCPVPFRAGWADALWRLGLAAGAVRALPGHGREVWRVATTSDSWAPIVTAALAAGELN